MKNYFYLAMLLVAAMLFTPSCKPNIPDDPTEQTDPDNPGDNPGDNPDDNPGDNPGGEQKTIEEIFAEMPAGIYRTNANSAYEEAILAKTSDGKLFFKMNSNPLKNSAHDDDKLFGWDGKNIIYEFFFSEKDNYYFYNMHEFGDTPSEYAGFSTYGSLAWWKSFLLGYVEAWHTGKYRNVLAMEFEKIDEAGSFQDTYAKIAQLIGNSGAPDISQQLLNTYKGYDVDWAYVSGKYYPKDMDDKKWVIPFTGSGYMEQITITRVHNWNAPIKGLYWAYGGCTIDNVSEISVSLSDVSEADAKAYVDQVIAQAHYDKMETEGYYYNPYFKGITEQDIPEGMNGIMWPKYECRYDSKWPYNTKGDKKPLLECYFTVFLTQLAP